jgi:hypothetical protein
MAMNAVVLEHVPITELPKAWREKLNRELINVASTRVTVRIEEEPANTPAETFVTDDPAFGIWRDRDDMDDVQTYMRRIRAPRFNRDGSRNELP